VLTAAFLVPTTITQAINFPLAVQAHFSA